MKKTLIFYLFYLCILTLFLVSCKDDDAPPAENPEEEITRVTLVFSDGSNSEDDITVVWFDEDGEGVNDPVIDPIELALNTTYTLSITLENTLATDEEEQDVTEEIREEADEHMFFFGFTNGLFTNPTGDGNIGSSGRNDPMNYLDEDENNQPLGLSTSWTTGDAFSDGMFRIILKHQPDLKSDVSTSETGSSDFDQAFVIDVQ